MRELEARLPQTQCGRCGHPGCLAYAEALAQGEAPDRCAPGGLETAVELARLLGLPAPAALDPRAEAGYVRGLASIDVERCIGCALCIPVCPTDAILGAKGAQHLVLEEDCTGCDLCLDACPVDCIELLPTPPQRGRDSAEAWRELFAQREGRRRNPPAWKERWTEEGKGAERAGEARGAKEAEAARNAGKRRRGAGGGAESAEGSAEAGASGAATAGGAAAIQRRAAEQALQRAREQSPQNPDLIAKLEAALAALPAASAPASTMPGKGPAAALSSKAAATKPGKGRKAGGAP